VGQQEGSRFMNERARPAKRVEVSSQQSEVRDGVSWRTNQIESKRIASHRIESRRIKSNPMEWQTQSGAIPELRNPKNSLIYGSYIEM